jgi:hypothetical protein
MRATTDHAAVRAMPSLPAILSLCDRVLGEIGRRSHLFAWLRAPGSGAQEWLAVDAYYPCNRLVVVCREERSADDDLYAELVPAHGLRLLRLVPSELGLDDADALADPQAAEEAVRGMIALLELPPGRLARSEREHEAEARDGAIARVAASLAQATTPDVFEPQPNVARTAAAERAARFLAARRSVRQEAPTPRSAPPRRTAATTGPYVGRRPPVARRGPTGARGDRLTTTAGRGRRPSEARPEAAAVGVLVGVVLAVVVSLELYAGGSAGWP